MEVFMNDREFSDRIFREVANKTIPGKEKEPSGCPKTS
jgi:hypothetical protein